MDRPATVMADAATGTSPVLPAECAAESSVSEGFRTTLRRSWCATTSTERRRAHG